MIVGVLNQKGGVGKTTLSLHLAGELARWGSVLLVDADPQASASDWAAQRRSVGLPARFKVVATPAGRLRRFLNERAGSFDFTVIDGPPRATGLARDILVAADALLIPVRPSPFDAWASGELLRLIDETWLVETDKRAFFVLNQCDLRTRVTRDTAAALDGFDPPALRSTVGLRVAFAEAARTGRLVGELAGGGAAAAEIAALAEEVRDRLPQPAAAVAAAAPAGLERWTA
jgi:chromosome partitioning protein